MSVCVTIRTNNIVDPDTCFNYFVGLGEQIIITSDEYPCLKFGNYGKAIRGIEINEEENGLEVRVCSFASKADYQLFAKTVDALMKLSGGRAYLDDDDEEEITCPLETFNEDWIEQERQSNLNIVKGLIAYSGRHITMFGLFAKFCIGPRMCKWFNALNLDECSTEDIDELEAYLCRIQWMCADLKDTSTPLVIPSPTGCPEKNLTISRICINGGKVEDFDYISEESLLYLADLDNENSQPVLIPFEQLWKILPDGVFQRLDERQFIREEELTEDMVHYMMARAAYLQPEDIHYKPSYPGNSIDEGQNTFILMWNPAISSVSLKDHNDSVCRMLTQYFNWSVWEYDKAKYGDRFFLVKVGDGNTGIVMSGVFDSNPFAEEDWSGKGRDTHYMDLSPNVMLNPEKAEILSTKVLEKYIPTFDWSKGHSGRMLTQQEAIVLEQLWEDFMERHSDKIDGTTMNAVHR